MLRSGYILASNGSVKVQSVRTKSQSQRRSVSTQDLESVRFVQSRRCSRLTFSELLQAFKCDFEFVRRVEGCWVVQHFDAE